MKSKDIPIGYATRNIEKGEILMVNFIGSNVSCDSIKLTQEGSDCLKIMMDDKIKRRGVGAFI